MTKATLYMIRSLSLLLIFMLVMGSAAARITLSLNGRELTLQQVPVSWVFDTSQNRQFERWNTIKGQAKYLDANNLKMSYATGMYWLHLDLSKLPTSDSVIYLEVHNPHINYLGAWLLSGSANVKQYVLTGDHEPFETRNVYHSQFVYKLSLHNRHNLQLVLLVDKRNEQLHLPLNFYNDYEFIKYQRNSNLIAGLFIGVLVFILLFTLFLYFNIREKLYVYYTLYVLMITGYIFSDLGFSFMFFYPDVPALADFARPFTISLAPIFYILFSRSLLHVKEHFPKMYRFTNYFLLFFVACFLIGFGVPNEGPVRAFWLIFMQVIMVSSILPVFIFSIASFRRGIKYSTYIIVASALFTFFTQLYMQYITGNLHDTFITRNAVNIGFSIELILLSLALSIRFKNYKLEAEDLLIKLNKQQENIFKTISDHQEQEMRRLSNLLHDSVGAGLSSIKYNLEVVKSESVQHEAILKSTIEDVSTLTDEIRNISHTLSPLLLQKKGLLNGLKHLTERYNRTGKIQIWIESIGSLDSSSFQNELLIFRMVQELLQNVIKHANATEVMIQLIIEPQIISVLVEDNGKGFNKADIKDGLGFSQIKELATFVKGRFEIRSEINKGCSVSIEFPTIPNETTDKSATGG
jgi:signal transduction histidine kinase